MNSVTKPMKIHRRLSNLSFSGLTFWGEGNRKFLFIVRVIDRLQKSSDMKGMNNKKMPTLFFIVGRMRIELHVFATRVLDMDKYINDLHKEMGLEVSIDFMIGYESLDSMYSFAPRVSSAGIAARYSNIVNIES